MQKESIFCKIIIIKMEDLHMSNLIKKLDNQREIHYLLSLKEYLYESKNYYDGKIIKNNIEIKKLLNELTKTSCKNFAFEIEEYFDIQENNIAESKRLENSINKINSQLKLLGYVK